MQFSDEPVLLLDEIQETGDFGGGVRYLTNQGCRVFLTGSNARVFERQLSAVLRGKVLVYRIFPLSFAEFVRSGGKPRFRHDRHEEVDFVTDQELVQVCTELSKENRRAAIE